MATRAIRFATTLAAATVLATAGCDKKATEGAVPATAPAPAAAGERVAAAPQPPPDRAKMREEGPQGAGAAASPTIAAPPAEGQADPVGNLDGLQARGSESGATGTGGMGAMGAGMGRTADRSAGTRGGTLDEGHGPGRDGEQPESEATRRPTQVRSIYLSNDDSMSLSSAQRIEYAIEKGLPLPREHIRPHELLNYYAFEAAAPGEGETFSAKADMSPGESGGFSLAVVVHGKDVTRESRQPMVLTLVVDVSGSMREEGKMDLLKRGLLVMLEQLKSGDVVNVVKFSHQVEKLLVGFRVGDDDLGKLRRVVEGLEPGGSTDLNLGLNTGYELASASRDEEKNNRVILVTDALANTGTVDERLIANVGKRFDEERIRLSGVGVGADFNDSLLDRLTERGKGAYVFLGSESVVDRVFGDGFTSLVETIATNVRFRLDLPESLAMERFYGEEASTDRSRVQAIHYFAGTTQLFLSDLKQGSREPEATDELSLTVEYEDPLTLESKTRTFSFNVNDILGDPSVNMRKARLLMAWAGHLATISDHDGSRDRSTLAKAESECSEAERDVGARARTLAGDVDVSRVVELLDTYCDRFEGAGPTRRNEFGTDGPAHARDE